MTLSRGLPLSAHAVLEALMAPTVIAVPFLLGFSGAAMVGAIVVGALLMGSAFHVSGRSFRISTHTGLDAAIAVFTGFLAFGLAVTGDLGGALFFAAVTGAQLLLSATTRFTRTSPHT